MKMDLKHLILLGLLAGISIFSYSVYLPLYSNEIAARQLIQKAYDMEKSEYYKAETKLRTNRIDLMDFGSGIFILFVSIYSFLIQNRVRKFKDLLNVQVLTKSTIFIIVNCAWLIQIIGTIWYYEFRLLRGDYAPFADSIEIPIMYEIPIYTLLFIPLNIFLLLTTLNIQSETTVFSKIRCYKFTPILREIFFITILLTSIICLYFFIIDGDHFSIISNIILTYVVFNLRANNINSNIQKVPKKH